jgi:hypothetical protein
MSRLRLPNLIIAGVAKAGTTSLFNYLAQHPEISPSDVKETRYFDPLRFGEPLGPIEDYAALFRHWQGERYGVEATPAYFQGGRRLASTIRDTLTEARVLVILREPIERCWSYFRFEKSRGRVPPDLDFEGYLDHCEALRSRGVDGLREHRAYLGLTTGCYARWMGDWHAEFGDHLKVLYFDDLSSDVAATVKDVCGWLGIDPDVVDDFDLAVENRTEQVRSRAAQQLALTLNRRSERFFRRNPGVKRRLRRAYYVVNGDPAELTMSDSAATRLAEFYAPFDKRLVEQLEGMNVPPPPWVAQGAWVDGPQLSRRVDLT